MCVCVLVYVRVCVRACVTAKSKHYGSRSCSTDGAEEWYLRGFGVVTWVSEAAWNICVDGGIILK